MKPEYWMPCILGLVWLCDHANEFNDTKNKKRKEKQNDERWWGANQRIEKSVHRSIKLSCRGEKNTREISTQDAVENGMQGNNVSWFKCYSLAGYISVTALFCFKEGLEMFLHC